LYENEQKHLNSRYPNDELKDEDELHPLNDALHLRLLSVDFWASNARSKANTTIKARGLFKINKAIKMQTKGMQNNNNE